MKEYSHHTFNVFRNFGITVLKKHEAIIKER